MEFRAVHKYAKTSAHKARQVVDLVRGHSVSEALRILQFTPRRAADMLRKLIESAVANATYQAERKREYIDPDTFVVREAYADEGPRLKRWRPRARGRAAPILKRTSHLTIVIGPPEEEEREQAAEEAAVEQDKA